MNNAFEWLIEFCQQYIAIFYNTKHHENTPVYIRLWTIKHVVISAGKYEQRRMTKSR